MREPVGSSTISSVGYDSVSETLEIEFQSGSVYQYYNVSQHTYDEFMAAQSKGQYLHYYIKNTYPYSRIG